MTGCIYLPGKEGSKTIRFRIIFLAQLAVVAFVSNGAAVHANDSDPNGFNRCVVTLQTRASSEGVSDAAIQAVFADVEQLPRVIASDRQQPEFTRTFSDYYNRSVTQTRVERGRTLARTHDALLRRVSAASGVPQQYLLAFWGLETNFGSYFGKLYIPSALTTLACDERRAEFFTTELMALLQIVDAGHIATGDLLGSWAGAIGHMQFMPSTYLRHAVDGDGDNKADLRGSIEDAMTSAGRYLASIGWEQGFRWGREVLLPEGFDYALSGSHQWRPLREWASHNVTDVTGKVMPDLDVEAALLLPEGHRGPAFLVYPNFKIIMKWNRSEYYALSVGRLADRIAGAGRLSRPLTNDKLATQSLFELQETLNELGYESGKADGVLGPGTRSAVQAFQVDRGLVADGYPGREVFNALSGS